MTRQQRRLLDRFVIALVALALVFAAGWLGYRVSRLAALERQGERGQQQLRLYNQTLASELARYDYLPGVLGLDDKVAALIENPRDKARVADANFYLAALNERSGTRAIYVLDAKGKVLATSNWQRTDSYLGEALGYRPYFRQAIAGQSGRFYGVGTTRGESGYYLSSPIGNRRAPVGVAVVKVGLEQLEAHWQDADSRVMLADENGVVILASNPVWRLSTLNTLSNAERERIAQSLQYNRAPLPAIDLSKVEALATGDELVHLERGPVLLSQRLTLPGSPWQLILLSPTGEVRRAAMGSALLAAALTALALTIAVALNSRRRRIAERLAARAALEAANNELERKVFERTADLSAANRQLKAEVAERIRAEANLRKTQDDLLQAGKLAVIGQMSTGIAHELNQPLAALRTLSGNTQKFLARGDLSTAQTNLATINQLVERMGRITGALKSFARKTGNGTSSANLAEALENALFLLDTRLKGMKLELVRDVDPELVAACDPNRLEQVLVNLIANALDAIAGVESPRLEIRAARHGDALSLTVRDNGAGFSMEAESRLFEPFFTTKPVGQGLGLGLTLSAGILDDYGGSLVADNHPCGGARFTLTLPPSMEKANHGR
ncbi:sensor histidine kinase [Crenobacter cavernae]|uniref:histidine kinase n=1 Tax=Crenobacter cavernae TaxID=2290923 RepID=A0ABY0FGK4_9NEIS|nr:ATP-binding protein [Crenobacter cavernae]RXZ45516.1 sensor histidine kinase [Crenobacter cavernae]